MTSLVLYSAQYQAALYAPSATLQFGALYMPNHDDKYQDSNLVPPCYKPQSIRMSHMQIVVKTVVTRFYKKPVQPK